MATGLQHCEGVEGSVLSSPDATALLGLQVMQRMRHARVG